MFEVTFALLSEFEVAIERVVKNELVVKLRVVED